MKTRVYYYNMVRDGKILGSVKCETAAQAKTITADLLGVDPATLVTRRVSSSGAADPVERPKKPEEKTTHQKEKSSTGDSSSKRSVTVDFSKSSKSVGQPNARQMAAWAQLKHDVADLDKISLSSMKTTWCVDADGLMTVKLRYPIDAETTRYRKIFIGRQGGLSGYGKRPNGHKKFLLTKRKEVLHCCYKDEKISLQ